MTYESLRRRNFTPEEINSLYEILANLKASWQFMRAARETGDTKYIEFESPYREE